MAAALVIVLVLSPPAAEPVATAAAVRTLERVLGDAAAVRVAGAGEEAPPAAAGVGGSEALRVDLAWASEGVGATVALVVRGRRLERQVRFDARDGEEERGRAVGLLLVSMLPEIDPQVWSRGGPDPGIAAQAPASSGDHVDAERARAVPDAGARGGAHGGGPARAQAPAPPGAARGTLRAAGLGAFAPRDDGGGVELGGMAVASWRVSPRVPLRVSAMGLGGSLSRASATSSLWCAAAGVGLELVPPDGPGPLAVTVAVDLGVARQSVTHFSPDDPAPVTQAAWLGTGSAALELDVRLVERFGAYATLGAHGVFGRVEVVVRNRLEAELEPLRLLAGAGVWAAF